MHEDELSGHPHNLLEEVLEEQEALFYSLWT